MLWTILQRLFEVPKWLLSSQKYTFVIHRVFEINTLFAIFSSKGLGNFNVRPNHTALKEMDAGYCKVFSSINDVKLVTKNYQKKVSPFRKYLLLKSCSFEKVAVRKETLLKKYIFWIVTYSGVNIQEGADQKAYWLTSVLKYTERKYVGQIGSL